MATRAEERARLRELRLAREERRSAGDRRLVLGGAGVLLAAFLIAGLVLISQSGAGGGGEVEDAAGAAAHLEGIPQRGAVLGEPGARVTVVEFGDLQCPVCRDYSETVVASLIEGPVRDGVAKLEYRNWVILGPQSRVAAAAALAAGEQNRLWSFTELFYRNQGIENSGYVSDDFLRAVAEGAGVPDLARWERQRSPARWDDELASVHRQAQRAGFSGTPSFLVLGPAGAEIVGTPHSAGDLEAAISRAG